MYSFATLQEAETALEKFIPAQLHRPAYTLDHVQAFMAYAGDPQNKIKAVHIAGTSGKTSSAYYAAALLGATGSRVGLLTSPHVEKITERVQVNLQPLDDQRFCRELAQFMNIVTASGIELSYAELLYAFAYWEFARLAVDYIVVETGLGGLLDATNVITRQDKICVITDISLDHTNVLGTTLPEIAYQKAGIIQQHNRVFSHRQDAVVMAEFQKAAAKKHATLVEVGQDPIITGQLSFLPLFQQRNFNLVLAAASEIIARDNLTPLTEADVKRAAHTYIPGRMEVIEHTDGSGRRLILDGAHNPHKLAALRASIVQQYPQRKVALMVSVIKGGGRNLADMLAELLPISSRLIMAVPVTAGRHQWYTTAELLAAAKQAGFAESSIEAIDNYHQAQLALWRRPEAVLVVTGSLYALAPMHSFIVSQQS